MKKFILLLAVILSCTFDGFILAQEQPDKIVIDTFGLSINNVEFGLPTDSGILIKLLGEPERISELPFNDILTWDNIGIVGYRTKNTNKINAIRINFKSDHFDFSPKSTYNGVVMLKSEILSVATKMQDLQNSKFIVHPGDNTSWDYEIGNLYIMAVLSEDYSELKVLEIGQNE